MAPSPPSTGPRCTSRPARCACTATPPVRSRSPGRSATRSMRPASTSAGFCRAGFVIACRCGRSVPRPGSPTTSTTRSPGSPTLRSRRVDGIIEIVPAERTVLVVCERERHGDIGAVARTDRRIGRRWSSRRRRISDDRGGLRRRRPRVDRRRPRPAGRRVDPTRTRQATYTVAFCGFSPGFAYLRGLDPVVAPRRAGRRRARRVPAGSVAIAAGYTQRVPVVVARRLAPARSIGRARCSTPTAPEPALLRPGMTVSFVPKAG